MPMPPMRQPDPQTLNRDHPRAMRDIKQAFRSEIAADPVARAQARLVGVNGSLQQVAPREPTKPGNISMHEHLTNLKGKLETDPEGMAQAEFSILDPQIASLNAEMQVVIQWP